MKIFYKHCAIRIQLLRPIAAIKGRDLVRQSKSSIVLNFILTVCVLFCLFQQIATAQAFNIPEPVPPPAEVSETFGLDTSFYKQWIDVAGMPVVASAQVSPYAVKESAYLIWQMIGHRPDIQQALIEHRVRFAIIGYTEVNTDIPEQRHWSPAYYHDVRGRGIGGDKPTTSEENLLQYPGDPYKGGSVLIHEFAHTIHEPILWNLDPEFDIRLMQAYEAAMATGLWAGTYASTNRWEYWAEGTNTWFNPKNPEGSFIGFGDTREDLKQYDPPLATLLNEVYGDSNWLYTPVATRTHQPHLQGFDPQHSPTFQWPQEAAELFFDELTGDPESTGDGRWINLESLPLSQLQQLVKQQALKQECIPTQIMIWPRGNLIVSVYRVAADGGEEFVGRFGYDLRPYDTCVGDLWLVKDESGENLALFRAEAKTGRALVNRQYKGPKVDVPDENLAAAVRKHLGLAASTSITQETLEALVEFGADAESVKNLTGLEHATSLVKLWFSENQIKDLSPLANPTQLWQLYLGGNQITDITPLAELTQLTHLHLWGNQIRDISALAGLTQLRSLFLDGNQIRDVSSLVGLSKLEELTLGGNPIQDMSPLRTLLEQNPDLELDIGIAVLAATSPKIEGPWLWMLVPTDQKTEAKPSALRKDHLAAASNGSVTEAQIATEGATEGDRVGNKVWTLGKLSPTSGDNINEVINATGLGKGYIDYHVAYGSIVLDSPQEQNTLMYAGSDDNHKVWLNGELVYEQLDWNWAHDYQESFQVTLKKGKNVLLVAVEDGAGAWSGFFGFEKDAVYTVSTVVEDQPTVPTWDVNQDGQINILDLVIVAQHLGNTTSADLQVDVNGDGTVNILDLVVVAQHLGESTDTASPSVLVRDGKLDPSMIQAWIEQAHTENDGSLVFQQGIANLQRLLALMIPKETVLLANYPNPFNPETWIPYELAESSDVEITIYDARGGVVRYLDLGHQPAGTYTGRTHAAYWNGRNALGEPVASGVYFYTLKAGEFTATRKMLIRK